MTEPDLVIVPSRGMPFRDSHFATVLVHAWRAGGRICDFGSERLDEIVTCLSESRHRPPKLVKAQWQVDMSARERGEL